MYYILGKKKIIYWLLTEETLKKICNFNEKKNNETIITIQILMKSKLVLKLYFI